MASRPPAYACRIYTVTCSSCSFTSCFTLPLPRQSRLQTGLFKLKGASTLTRPPCCSKLLADNPTGTGTGTMLAALEADRARVADLGLRILDLERSLSALRTEQAFVQERLDSYTYPVLTLPTDIVSEIFINCLPAYPLCSYLMSSQSPPILLSHICHDWREVALATPRLWRAMKFPSRRASFLDQVDLWLSRSRSCALSIDINDGPGFGSVSDGIAAVLSHRDRWEHAKLRLHPVHLNTFKGPLPLLRHLNLALSSNTNEFMAFRDAPLLRTVTLNYGYASMANIILPWAQLTSLTLDRVLPQQCYPVLQRTPNLVHLSCILSSRDAPNDSTYRGPDIELPYLESMELDLGFNRLFTGFCLEDLVFPDAMLIHLIKPVTDLPMYNRLDQLFTPRLATVVAFCFHYVESEKKFEVGTKEN
ncbi:hypothetical protein DFH06DRAFT_1297437 [Mycena polygramma]|nr:hypothetical protein DFH06DRAFT_1297437 [Mycena polygramma]